MTDTAIAASGLRKSYGEKVVLDGISLNVPAGTVFSLLGPNGAGKTTTVHILSTLIRADAGDIRVAGHDLARHQDAARKIAATYSGGMRRRLDLAMTLVGRPTIIFLDEPTTGLDPRSRRTVWQIIRDLVAGGVTIFLTTQYLEEADQLADRIAVLDQGKLVAEGTPAQLKRQIPGGHITLEFADLGQLDRAGVALGVTARDTEAMTLQVPSDGGMRSVRALLDRLDGAAVEPVRLAVHTPDLDDVYLALTETKKEAMQ